MKTNSNLRSFIDLTPWDKTGHSAFGLTSKQARWIARILIIISVLLMSPPGFPDPTDIINIFLAAKISQFTGWSPIESLIATYTIIPWIIFLIGIWIYPYSTESLLSGYINKLQKFIKKHIKNPIVVIIAVIVGYHLIKFYSTLI